MNEQDLANRVIRLALPTIIAAASAAVSDPALGTLGAPIGPKWVPGTVGSAGGPGTSLSIRLDPDANAITAQNLAGCYLPIGTRVMALLIPPHGAFIAHIITPTAGTRALLFDQIADGVTSSWTFAVPQDYFDLEYRFEWAPAVSAAQSIYMRFNGDSLANYYRSVNARAYGGALSTVDSTTQTELLVGDGYQNERLVISQGVISSYRSTAVAIKTASVYSSTVDGNAASIWGSAAWASSAAITAALIGSGAVLAVGSRLRVWGVV